MLLNGQTRQNEAQVQWEQLPKRWPGKLSQSTSMGVARLVSPIFWYRSFKVSACKTKGGCQNHCAPVAAVKPFQKRPNLPQLNTIWDWQHHSLLKKEPWHHEEVCIFKMQTVVLVTTAAVFSSVDYGRECANGGWPIWSFQRLILIDFESRSAICMNVGQQPIKKCHYLFSLTIFINN